MQFASCVNLSILMVVLLQKNKVQSLFNFTTKLEEFMIKHNKKAIISVACVVALSMETMLGFGFRSTGRV